MEEIWKDIVGYEGKYLISNLGKIKSLNFNKTGKIKIMSIRYNHHGYCTIALCKNGIPKYYFIHRLVAQAFILNPLNLLEINHKDGNKLNNSIDNIEWCTRSENNFHSYRQLGRKPINNKGEKNPKCKLSWIKVNDIRQKRLIFNISYNNLAKEFGVDKSTISSIILNKTWINPIF